MGTIGDSSKYEAFYRSAIQSTARFDSKLFDNRWAALFNALADFSSEKPDLHDIQPPLRMTTTGYKKVITEYERVLNGVVRDYMDKPVVTDHENARVRVPRLLSKAYSAGRKTKHSIVNDGMSVTAERVARKLYNKTLGRH